jgi:hypothetical protein
MKLSLKIARSAEERASRIAPLPLPEHAGFVRFAKTMNDDKLYRACVAGAFGLALLAGGGFGHTALVVGWLQGGLWCLTAAGVAVRALMPEATVSDANVTIINRSLVLWGILIAVSAVLASLASGANALPVIGAAGLIAGSMGLASRTSIVGKPWVAPVTLILGIVAVISHFERIAILGLIAAGVLSVAIVVLVLRVSPLADGKVNTFLMLTRCAALAWAWAVFDAGGPNDFRLITFMIVMISLAGLDIAASRSHSFAVTVAAVIFVHLAAMAQDMRSSYSPLWAQFAVACVQAVLLVVAAFRHATVSWWLLPRATYRVAPLCVVPRLDRAQDHPVKINVG